MKRVMISIYEYVWATLISSLPSHTLRYFYIKLLNPSVRPSSTILMNVRFKGVKNITFDQNQVINQHATLDGRGGLVIGKNVDIAERAVIWSMSHDPNSDSHTTIKLKTIISDYAWIGADSIVLAGVCVGEGAVVGAGSVVTRDVAPLSIVAGNPAKVIGMRGGVPTFELTHRPFLK